VTNKHTDDKHNLVNNSESSATVEMGRRGKVGAKNFLKSEMPLLWRYPFRERICTHV